MSDEVVSDGVQLIEAPSGGIEVSSSGGIRKCLRQRFWQLEVRLLEIFFEVCSVYRCLSLRVVRNLRKIISHQRSHLI